MKKYLLSLVVLIFALGFGLFTINANVASAANCAPGDLFSSVTGQSCGNTSSVVTCPTGDLFNILTGQRCTAWSGNSGDDFSQLGIGSRGDLVRAFQQMLKDAGFLNGNADGIYGRLTDGAAKKYYQKYPMPCLTPASDNAVWGRICPPTPIPSPDDSFSINPSSASIKVGGTVTFQAVYNNCPKGAQCFVGPLPVQALWSSGNDGIINISVSSDGRSLVVTGVSQGTTTIGANYTNGSGNHLYASAVVTVSSNSSSTITVLSPNGGENWVKGTTQTISWSDTNNISTHEIKLDAYRAPCTGQICPMYMTPTPYTIANTQGSSYNWTVGNVWPMNGVDVAPDGLYMVEVCQSGTSICDQSNSYFSISSGTTNQCLGGPIGCVRISYLSPSYGVVGTQVTLTGTGFAMNASNTIHFGSYATIAGISSSDGSTLKFTVPYSNDSPFMGAMPTAITPGTYNVSVSNYLGTSLPTSFTVIN